MLHSQNFSSETAENIYRWFHLLSACRNADHVDAFCQSLGLDAYETKSVQLIVAIELFELFVGDTSGPRWLKARSIDDLKKPIADFLVLFVAIKGIAEYLKAETGDDQLDALLAPSLLIAALTGFRVLTALVKAPKTADDKLGPEPG